MPKTSLISTFPSTKPRSHRRLLSSPTKTKTTSVATSASAPSPNLLYVVIGNLNRGKKSKLTYYKCLPKNKLVTKKLNSGSIKAGLIFTIVQPAKSHHPSPRHQNRIRRNRKRKRRRLNRRNFYLSSYRTTTSRCSSPLYRILQKISSQSRKTINLLTCKNATLKISHPPYVNI